ncbi:hypothetical protein MSG28_004099 [Choristoneura fumiferana]|uniref:Uncharacterized protein n=2 Tax=Choristoneura fumiferana TaxID=7141 RepID=A0ACC0KIP5_CHOFU|nr:hypothetical protein MSG28_004099 [Choristoneura fumiferana]
MQDSLYLQDLGSRYGTFINQSDEKIGTTSKVQLKHNDTVKFGKLNSVWTVQEIKHITCTSTLKGENLQNLKVVLDQLGGTLKNDWDHTCTYLTMPAITLTIKVVLALVQGSWIVTTQFWNECLNAVNNGKPLPDPKQFIPQVIESTINKDDVTFLPDERRGKLFTDRKFIFFSRRQLEMYKTVLLNSSATPLLLSESRMTKSMLCNPNVIVIQYILGNTSQESQSQKNQINDIVNYLKSKGRRAVADAEIGLAVLYCSTDKYCNPDFSFTSEVFKQSHPSTTNVKILAPETQETTQTMQCKKENIVINESLTPNHKSFSASTISSLNTAGNSKRKLNEEISENIMSTSKKIATGSSIQENPTQTDSSKRKLNDEEVLEQNPSKKMAIGNNEQNDQDDFFNFIDSKSDSAKLNKTTEKKLNFFKPTKKAAADPVSNEDDLFNFVQDTSKPTSTKQMSIKKMFDVNKSQPKKENSLIANKPNNSRDVNEESEDEELHSIMKDLDLGSTIVKLRKNLIVKKESVDIEVHTEGPNFKKFKKVWPVKMRVTIIPKSSMSIVRPEGFTANEISALTMNISDDE